MASMAHSRQRTRRRFRDIALFDVTEDESEVTATTSVVQTMNSKNANVSFVDQLKNQRKLRHQFTTNSHYRSSSSSQQQHQQQQQSPPEEKEEPPFDDDEAENDFFRLPRLSASLLRQQDQSYPHQEDTGKTTFLEETAVKSQAFSVADLSMEAETGKFWGGATATAQRLHSSSTQQLQNGSLFLGKLNDRLLERFSPERKKQDPSDLALTATESTDSCSSTANESYSLNSHNNRSAHESSIDLDIYGNMSYEQYPPEPTPMDEPPSCSLFAHHQVVDDDEDPDEDEILDGILDDFQTEFQKEVQHDEDQGGVPKEDEVHNFKEEEEEEDDEAIQDEAIPAWKLKQRQKMRLRMGLVEEEPQEPPSLEPQTPLRMPKKQLTQLRSHGKSLLESPEDEPTPQASEKEQESPTKPQTPETIQTPVVTPPEPEELATKSWKNRHFRRTFRHKAVRKRGGTFESETSPSQSPEHQSTPLSQRPSLATPKGDDVLKSPSPIQRLRGIFESPRRRTGVEDSADSIPLPQTKRTVAAVSPRSLFSRETQEENTNDIAEEQKEEKEQFVAPQVETDDDDESMHQEAESCLPSQEGEIDEEAASEDQLVGHFLSSNSFSSDHPSEDPESQADENDEDVVEHPSIACSSCHDTDEDKTGSCCTNEAPKEALLVSSKPSVWWTEMKDKVDRYHRSVVGRAVREHGESDTDNDEILRKAFEVFAEQQNQLGRAMAVSLFRGMELERTKHDDKEAAHAQELKDLKEKHERELRELRQQLVTKNSAANSNTNNRAAASPVNNTNRNEAFRQRFLDRLHSKNNLTREDKSVTFAATRKNVADGASTVVSNMSCRELSVERYRARLLQQMNRGRAPSAAASSFSAAVSNDLASVASTTASERSSNKKNAQEIDRLLDELQQAERRQKLLEKQLQQAGVVLAEDIPYQMAKDKVAAISKRMNEIGSSSAVHDDPLVQKQLREEYFRLEKDMEKYLSALMLTDEYAEEQRLEAEQWEDKHAPANEKALEAVRKHMPVDIRTLSAKQLEEDRGLPKPMVQKFRRTNVLQLLRVDPKMVSKWHPSTLEAFRVTGLTLTERRALHCYLRPIADIWRGKAEGSFTPGSSDPMTSRKLAWYNTMKSNFQEAMCRYEQHLGGTNGKPKRHIHTTCLANRCELVGNQCPIRANRSMDYFATDLGFPASAVYEDSKVVASPNAPKSAAEVIAEAKGVPLEAHVCEGPVGTPKPSSTPLRSTRPKHPLMNASSPKKPGGLLAAIAARRID